jgi:hypothetical protein
VKPLAIDVVLRDSDLLGASPWRPGVVVNTACRAESGVRHPVEAFGAASMAATAGVKSPETSSEGLN